MFLKVRRHFLYNQATSVPVTYMPTPHRSGLIDPKLVVVHDASEGETAEEVVTALNLSTSRASAHFVVGTKGELIQLAPLNVKTWHAGKSSYSGQRNVNNFSIGIMLVNPGRLTPKYPGTKRKEWLQANGAAKPFIQKGRTVHQKDTAYHGVGYWWVDYTPEQYATLFAVLAALKDAYNIIDIVGHYQVSPGSKFDPNPLFQFDRLKGAVTFTRGPRNPAGEIRNKDHIWKFESAKQETDEIYVQDLSAKVNCNLRAAPDASSKLIAEIKVNGAFNILRPELDHLNRRWYLVEVPNTAIQSASQNGHADADGKYRGYVLEELTTRLQ